MKPYLFLGETGFAVTLNLFRSDTLLLLTNTKKKEALTDGHKALVYDLVAWLFANMNDWMIGDSDDCVSIVAEPSNVSASGRIHVGVGFHQTSPPPTPEPRAGAHAPPPPANVLPHHSPPQYSLAASADEDDREMVKPTKHKPVKRVTFKVND